MTQILEQYPISLILPSGNDPDHIFIAHEMPPKRKKGEKWNVILKVDIKFSKNEPEPIGYFVGELQAIYR